MKPFDVSKFRKSLTKSIDGLGFGFNDPTDWISTGSYALNYAISGDFHKGVPLGKVTVFGGQTGSGKSYICSGNIIKHAQDQGIYVVLIDSENALDESWLLNLGVVTTEDKLLKLNMAMIDDVAKTISEFMKEYKTLSDRPKVLFVIDSLGMLLTPTDVDQFDKGELKGDMGRKPKALTALVRNCVNMFGSYNVGLVATNHSYSSQNMFDPDDVISGGQGFIYASSIVVAMQKLKLKENEEGEKVSDVRGIRSKCKVMKTRYNQPFTEIEIKIPWDTGMDPYSGLYDLFERKRLIFKDSGRFAYIDLDGVLHKYTKAEWATNADNILGKIMEEFDVKMAVNSSDDDVDDETKLIEILETPDE